ncbi:hypothetical protein [Bradyrhizobium embrapense]
MSILLCEDLINLRHELRICKRPGTTNWPGVDAVKTPIRAKDLELIALREIRSFPGGEYVCYLEVEPTNADWGLHVTVRDAPIWTVFNTRSEPSPTG